MKDYSDDWDRHDSFPDFGRHGQWQDQNLGDRAQRGNAACPRLIPGFTAGTLIATPRGEIPVEDLREGDLVFTRDNGFQRLRWTGTSQLSTQELAEAPHLRPVRIAAGQLVNRLPERDLTLSPSQLVLIRDSSASLLFDEPEVLVAAADLLGRPGVSRVEEGPVSYHHLLCDGHEILLSNGAWTESFRPGVRMLHGMEAGMQARLLRLLPALRRPVAGADNTAFEAARRVLPRQDALLLGI